MNSSAPTEVPGLDHVVELSASEEFVCARRSDRSVWCWGRNDGGQLGDGTTTDRAHPVRVRF